MLPKAEIYKSGLAPVLRSEILELPWYPLVEVSCSSGYPATRESLKRMSIWLLEGSVSVWDGVQVRDSVNQAPD